MSSTRRMPTAVAWTLRLEQNDSLDRPVAAIRPTVRRVFGAGARGAALRGDWLGHALHPVLTDVVVGSWTSATVLDLVGGRRSAAAAQRLIGTGLLAAGPTAWSGWAEWSEAGPREQRVGLVHAAASGAAIGAYAASWAARRRGHRGRGILLGMLGSAVMAGGGYLGGHLASARNLGSRHPAFDEAAVGE